jgi:arginine N-succinyltransferase
MTTFPPNRDALATKVETAAASFAGKMPRSEAQYLMVLEDTESKKLLGVSAVYPEIGRPYGFFSYHVNRLIQHSEAIGLNLDCKVLTLSNSYTGMTEIGTLAVSPNLRRGGAGRLLAQARYMLMASFPEQFSEHVIAEMRGWQEPDGSNPFWTAVGKQFFGVDFPVADEMSAVKGVEFIANLMPKFPIYLDLLPSDAQAAIGKAHATSAIAMRMLAQEGFRFEGFVDVFDAGPQVIARLDDIRTVKNSQLAKVVAESEGTDAEKRLIANGDLKNFRLVRGPAGVTSEGIALNDAFKNALQVESGDEVRHVLS